jgi:hypothetical protein
MFRSVDHHQGAYNAPCRYITNGYNEIFTIF